MTKSKFQTKKGQTMVLTVMLLSSAVLSATAIIGLLMLYEIRHATNVIASAKAVFAADSGIECSLMKNKEDSLRDCGESAPSDFTCSSAGVVVLDNGSCYRTEDVLDADDVSVGKISIGRSGQVSRAFEVVW